MGYKIVFIGPPSVGKTTLRKIFFEFESAERLLEFALDPTYGIESIVLDFGQKIGVFDLSGQENEKWLDTEEKEVFSDANYIVNILDASDSLENILRFAKRVREVRDEISPNSKIYLLIHKIDLISDKELRSKKTTIKEHLEGIDKYIIEFTSIKKKFFLKTLEVFRELIRATINNEIPLESLDYTFIREVLAFLNQFRQSDTRTISKIKTELKYPTQKLESIIQVLGQKSYIEVEGKGEKRIFHLNIEYKDELMEQLSLFSMGKLIEIERKYFKKKKKPIHLIPPIVGVIIGDVIGTTLLTVESEEGAFNQFLGINEQTELDLIAPFISALEHFSKEMNVVDLANFMVKTKELNIYIVRIENYLITFFVNPRFDINEYKETILSFFDEFIKNHQKEFEKAEGIGSIDELLTFEPEIKNFLLEINENYNRKIEKIDFFDIENAKELYGRMDDFFKEINETYINYLERIAEYKSRLISAIMRNKFPEIEKISSKYTELKQQYYQKENID